MADPDRRPSAEEIEELIGLCRRDPASPAFVDLGDAYLALGRPRDAIEIGTTGLAAAPDNMEGRVMVARGHAALHQWKEAQAELLRVVKVDRASKGGFALLGEVLLRRSDYERAIPVLQHAQNLDPANPAVLALLRKARAGQPLDPPAPLPTAIAVRRKAPAPIAAPVEPPTRVDPRPAALDAPRPAPRPSAPPPAPAPPPRSKGPTRPPPMPVVPPAFDDGPTSVAGPQHRAATDTEATAVRGDPTEVSPPRRDFERDHEVAAKPRLPLEPAESRPVQAPAAVRPRVIPAAKPINAAAASLRQSAAVGEGYLNDLLTGGLLDVPGVRVPDAEFDIRPDKRWGRSSTRMFIGLFVVLFLAAGGGVGWYFYSEQQRQDEIAEHRAAAHAALATTTWDGVQTSLTELAAALDLDQSSGILIAEVAQATAINHILYGGDGEPVSRAISQVTRELSTPDLDGYHELLIARVALALADLHESTAPDLVVATAKKDLTAWLDAHGDDRWARWLLARAQLAAGERTAAMASLAAAADAPNPADRLAVAQIDRADLLVDDGKLDQALALYDEVLKAHPGHPLALVGKALARVDGKASATAALDDLNVGLAKSTGPRVDAYRQLALALAQETLQYYQPAKQALDLATGPIEPRFLARVAIARAQLGDLAGAAQARAGVTWYGNAKPETDPVVAQADAMLLLASGRPETALATAKGDTIRARILRGQALLDLGRAKDAQVELDAAFTAAPDTVEIEIFREEARMIAGAGKDRDAAASALDKIAREANTKLGRHAQGVALLAIGGDAKDARNRLTQALDGITDEQPNPVAYRTHAALAQLALAATPPDLDAAAAALEAATTANPGYLPALALRARVMLSKGDADGALAMIDPVIHEREAMTAAAYLTLAEALAIHKADVKPADKDEAKAALEAAKAAGAAPEEIGRIAALIDPTLPEALGVPAPAPPPGTPAPKPPRRHGR
jgi:tetratricopeptide (TPR) repeat protein